ncbi:MAG TPA: T9SS type A sorting domain-containing protein [Bacteroidales bacterium]|nr:T9SS type A sorting domain-containing protein [Bacteroidales bacterium]
MKKIYLLFALVVMGVFSLNAQVIYTTDFDTLTAGTKLAAQTGDPWTTWSLAPGGAEDPVVSTTQAHSGANSVNVLNGNDCVLQFFDKTTGRYKIEWYMFVETGKLGYFNLLSDFNAGSSKWAFQAFIYNDSIFIDANGAGAALTTFPINSWVKCHIIVDLDDDFATFYRNDVEIISYQWSKGAQGSDNSLKLDGMNFYGWDNDGAGTSGYYIDDVTLEAVTAPAAPLNLTATLNGADIDVSWTAPVPNPDLYKLSRNGVVVNSTTSLAYTDVAPWANTYIYAARAYYAGQGYSHGSNTDTATITGGVTRNLVLMEEGTGTWCTYCPGAAMGLRDLIETNHKNAVAIAYHSGDTYENTYSTARLNYYGINSFPTVVGDGARESSNMVAGGSGTVSMYPSYLSIYNSRIATPSFQNLDLTVVETGTDTYTATITAEETFAAFAPAKLYAVLTESNIAETWFNQSEVDFVCRSMYPDVNGTTLNFATQNPQTTTINFTTTGYVKNNCEFVVFIQDDNTHEVSQVAKIDMSAVVGTEEITGQSISIYPNPASEYIMALTSGNGTIEIFDITGKLVSKSNILKTSETIDIRGLEKGLYVVKVTSKENSFTEKLVIE